MKVTDKNYCGYPYTEVSIGKAKAKIWPPSDLHNNYQVEFKHTTISDVPTKEEAIKKAEKYLLLYPSL